MELIPSGIEIQENNLFNIHTERFKMFLHEDSIPASDNLYLSNDEIEQIDKLKNESKNKILSDFLSSERIDSDKIVSSIIIISFQYLSNKHQAELAIKSLIKILENDISFTFNTELIDQLIQLIIFYNQSGNTDMIQKSIYIINLFIKKYSKSTDSSILSELAHSDYPNILLKCDMKLPEVTCSYWYLLRIQNNKYSTFVDQIYNEEELKHIMEKCVNILSEITNEEFSCQDVQFERLLKYLFKCISIFPRDSNFDCHLTDIICTIASCNPSLQIKEIAIKLSIKRNFKSKHISHICFNIIKFIISDIEAHGKADQESDKLFITCLNYLNISFNLWLNDTTESKKDLELAISMIEYITENKSFKFVNSILPIAEQIINKTHWINMKFEEMLINHIDNSEIGKLCLLTSFMATENMPTTQFFDTLNMYIEMYPILDSLYNSEQCDKMTTWIIDAIWTSISKYLDEDLQ